MITRQEKRTISAHEDNAKKTTLEDDIETRKNFKDAIYGVHKKLEMVKNHKASNTDSCYYDWF